LGFDLAFKYRNPVLVLGDGIIGQMMEKVELDPQEDRLTHEEVIKKCPWATTGRTADRERNVITSLELDSNKQEQHNIKLQNKYQDMQDNEVRYETFDCEDAEYLIIAYGSSARICQKTVQLAREKGLKVGLFRPITLFPFPIKEIFELSKQVKGILTVEMSAGQMIEDVKLAVECKVQVEHFGRMGGIIPLPDEVLLALEEKIIGG